MAQANVHYVFGSKEQLYRAVIEQLTDELIEHVRGVAPQSTDFATTVGELVADLWRSVEEEPDRHQLLIELQVYGLRVPQLKPTVVDNQVTVIATTATIIQDAADRCDCVLLRPATTLARHFLAGFDGLTLQHISAADVDAEQAYLAELVSALVALATGQLVPAGLIGIPAIGG
ncbi:TetR/AcrR family transcriptional regulator [Mycobacterium sp. BMJ-28]